jgi:hypothetical protein
MQLSALTTTLLLTATTASAVPMDSSRLEDLQCRCVSFSTDAKPTLCTYMESYRLDMHTATSFARDHDLAIQFASPDTVDRVLRIRKPLPSYVLRMLEEDGCEDEVRERENRIVCGFRDEVRGLDGRGIGEEEHFVGWFVCAFVGIVGVYLAGEYLWSRYVSLQFPWRVGGTCLADKCFRFFSHGNIKLDGDEKPLLASADTDAEEDPAHLS